MLPCILSFNAFLNCLHPTNLGINEEQCSLKSSGKMKNGQPERQDFTGSYKKSVLFVTNCILI